MIEAKPLAIPDAKDILVREAPNGGEYFNGMSTLKECVMALEPRFQDLPETIQRIILKTLKTKLKPLRNIAKKEPALFLLG